jgi:hypothetical protein
MLIGSLFCQLSESETSENGYYYFIGIFGRRFLRDIEYQRFVAKFSETERLFANIIRNPKLKIQARVLLQSVALPRDKW